MELDEEIEGFRVVAESLKRLGVKYMFGVVGIPVVEVNYFVFVSLLLSLINIQ